MFAGLMWPAGQAVPRPVIEALAPRLPLNMIISPYRMEAAVDDERKETERRFYGPRNEDVPEEARLGDDIDQRWATLFGSWAILETNFVYAGQYKYHKAKN